MRSTSLHHDYHERSPGIDWLYLGLLIFFAVNALLINFFLSHIQPTTVWDWTLNYLRVRIHQSADSWLPMRSALEYLSDGGDKGLYQQMFFAQKTKFIYPPTSLVPIEPLFRIPQGQFITIMNWLSWIAVALSAYFLFRVLQLLIANRYPNRQMSVRESAGVLLLSAIYTVTFYPIVKSWELGQAQTFINLLFPIALYAFLRERQVLSGVAIGLICLIKPQLSLMFIWGLVRRNWRFLLGLSIPVIIGLAISILRYGWENHLEYLQVLSYISRYGEAFYPNQSINGFLNRLLFIGNSLKWDPHNYPPYNVFVHLGTIVSSVALVGSAILITARRPSNSGNVASLEFSIAVLSFTIASPIAWEHHYGIMLPMYAVTTVLATYCGRRTRISLIACLMLSFVLSSNFWQVTLLATDSHFNFVESYLLAGALLLLGCMYYTRHILLGSGYARSTN